MDLHIPVSACAPAASCLCQMASVETLTNATNFRSPAQLGHNAITRLDRLSVFALLGQAENPTWRAVSRRKVNAPLITTVQTTKHAMCPF